MSNVGGRCFKLVYEREKWEESQNATVKRKALFLSLRFTARIDASSRRIAGLWAECACAVMNLQLRTQSKEARLRESRCSSKLAFPLALCFERLLPVYCSHKSSERRRFGERSPAYKRSDAWKKRRKVRFSSREGRKKGTSVRPTGRPTVRPLDRSHVRRRSAPRSHL